MSQPPPLADIYPGTLDCVHCGLCLPACPTYRETGRETSSPRGRIYLMRAVAEGRIDLTQALSEEAWLCLGCRACETACPSGVRFGALLEGTRAALPRPGWRGRLEAFALRRLVPRPRRLRAAVSALALAQRLRLDRLAARLLPGLGEARQLMPPVPPRAQRAPLPERIPATGPRRGAVALFRGCIMPELFGPVNAATARVLTRNGFDVVVPPAQGCCGALQIHAGQAELARELARANLAAFREPGIDAVVVNSAGCSAALREYDHWLGAEARGTPAVDPTAFGPTPVDPTGFSTRVRDVCEFLDEVGLVAPLRRLPLRVCYDDPCHLLHGQGVGDAPRRVLARIPGLELVPHADPGACCGAAGTYNLTRPEMSRAVLARKIASLAAADPDAVASGNPGCLMQLQAGVRQAGLRARVVHPVELLDEAAEPAG